MLRVGLTGDLGSGKSTVAAAFAARGAILFSSDEIATQMMQPGEPVYAEIVRAFGSAVVCGDGSLDRRALAHEAFTNGRVEELNAIIHPAVLREQERLLTELAATQSHAIAVIESALIFTTRHGIGTEPWRLRFDRIVLVCAPLQLKVDRYVARSTAGRETEHAQRHALAADARARLALQTSINDAHAAECLVIDNDADQAHLLRQVDAVWLTLQQAEASTR